jgi:heme-degrading monooxygenase HmoA
MDHGADRVISLNSMSILLISTACSARVLVWIGCSSYVAQLRFELKRRLFGLPCEITSSTFRRIAMKLAKYVLVVGGLLAAASGAYAQSSRDLVIINPLEVKAGRDAECLASWDKAATVLRSKPGFKSVRLFRANNANAQNSFVTVGVWSNYEQYEAAVADQQFRSAFSADVCASSPAPYRAVRELRGSGGQPNTPTELLGLGDR